MAVEAMMSRYQAAASGGERGFCTPEEARGIRAAVWRAVAVPRLARDLFLHGGLGAWLLWLLQTPEGRRDPDSEAFAMRLFEMLLQHDGIRQRATAATGSRSTGWRSPPWPGAPRQGRAGRASAARWPSWPGWGGPAPSKGTRASARGLWPPPGSPGFCSVRSAGRAPATGSSSRTPRTW